MITSVGYCLAKKAIRTHHEALLCKLGARTPTEFRLIARNHGESNKKARAVCAGSVVHYQTFKTLYEKETGLGIDTPTSPSKSAGKHPNLATDSGL